MISAPETWEVAAQVGVAPTAQRPSLHCGRLDLTRRLKAVCGADLAPRQPTPQQFTLSRCRRRSVKARWRDAITTQSRQGGQCACFLVSFGSRHPVQDCTRRPIDTSAAAGGRSRMPQADPARRLRASYTPRSSRYGCVAQREEHGLHTAGVVVHPYRSTIPLYMWRFLANLRPHPLLYQSGIAMAWTPSTAVSPSRPEMVQAVHGE